VLQSQSAADCLIQSTRHSRSRGCALVYWWVGNLLLGMVVRFVLRLSVFPVCVRSHTDTHSHSHTYIHTMCVCPGSPRRLFTGTGVFEHVPGTGTPPVFSEALLVFFDPGRTRAQIVWGVDMAVAVLLTLTPLFGPSVRRLAPNALLPARHVPAAMVSASADLATLWHSSARELEATGKMIEAIAHMQQAVKCTSDDVFEHQQRRLWLGMLYEDIGYIEEAIAVYEGLSANHSRWKMYLANVLLDGRGEKHRALQLYREACDATRYFNGPTCGLRGAHLLGLYGRGVCADSLGLVQEATESHQQVLALEPHDGDSAFHLLVLTERALGAESAELRARYSHVLPQHRLTSWDYMRSLPFAGKLASLSSGAGKLATSTHYYTHDMLHLALDEVAPQLNDGLVLEFGVYFGKSIRMIAERLPSATVHGFDTFSGLPEDWTEGEQRGSYSTDNLLPPAPSNVRYHVGTFDQTLPGFLKLAAGPVRFMNVDCDLYSSTRQIFEALHERIVAGTVIVFDEYVMTSRWRDDEFKAFQEVVASRGWRYEYLGISLVSGQAAVRITFTNV